MFFTFVRCRRILCLSINLFLAVKRPFKNVSPQPHSQIPNSKSSSIVSDSCNIGTRSEFILLGYAVSITLFATIGVLQATEENSNPPLYIT